MGARKISPETLEERLIYATIVATWGFWLLGALYVIGPLLGYALVLIIAGRWLEVIGAEPWECVRFPPGALVWMAGMFAMLLALVAAHVDRELDLVVLLKSTAGWIKGWALMAVFVLAGAALQVRPAVVYRAVGVLALQTLLLAPAFILAANVGLPSALYVSPMSLIGGPGHEFFDVTLYSTDDTSGRLRWRFFSPWATAAAFLAGIGFVFALYEKSWQWKFVGLGSAIVVCWMTGSRLALVALPVVVALTILVSNVRRPAVLAGLGFAVAVLLLLSDEVALAYQDLETAFTSARAASSRVRATLANIAYHRWLTEAPVFGHGIVERGPHLVEFMPIGSHHTWLGLLFVKGAVGFLSLAIPLAWSMIELTLKAQSDRVARAGLGVLVALLLFSFGDNLEIVAYLIWPGLLIVGIATRRRLCRPYAAFLGQQRG